MNRKNLFLKLAFLLLSLFLLFSITSDSAHASSTVHIVKRGEWLSTIAQKFGAPVSSLIKANNIFNPNLIYPGQKIVIPSPSTTSAQVNGGRWVEVDLSEQRLYLWMQNQIVFSTLVSTGLPQYPTPTGRFTIARKLVADDMRGGSRVRGDYYFLPKVPRVMYFYRGYALHGTYWHNNFGRPMSRGCINLSIPDAAFVFQRLNIGDLVVVHT